MDKVIQKNVLGTELQCCCLAPKTGYFRDGYCRTDAGDFGRHTICAQVTAAFLEFSKNQGNDLSTPRPEFDFPGLQPGDRWCLCARRWKEAWHHDMAPDVVLEACHESALEIVDLDTLQQFAVKANH